MCVLTPAMVHELAFLVTAIAALLKVIWPKRINR
jgi:hypothetical protein